MKDRRKKELSAATSAAGAGTALQALEDLQSQVGRMAVLADLAAEHMQDLSLPVGDEARRRRANRAHTLVAIVADEAEATAARLRAVVERCSTEQVRGAAK